VGDSGSIMLREFREKWEVSEVLRAFCVYTVLAVSLSIFLAEVTWPYHVKSLAETPPGPILPVYRTEIIENDNSY
jgi:hypothetical protein